MRFLSTTTSDFDATAEFKHLIGVQNEVASSTTAFRTAKLSEISENKLNTILSYLADKIGRKPIVDYTYKSGKLIGILRTIAYAGKLQEEFIDTLGISKSIVDDFVRAFGNAAYVKDGVLVEETPMDIEATKDILILAGSCLEVLVDVSDITPQRIAAHYEYRRNVATKTMEKTPQMPQAFDE